MISSNTSTTHKKPLIYVLLAGPFFTDPRIKQEVSTFDRCHFPSFVLSWDREGIYRNYKKNSLEVKSLKLLSSRKFSKIQFVISALLFQISIVLFGLKLKIRNKRIIIHANDFNTLFGAVILKVLYPNSIKLVYDSHELTPAVYEEWYGKFTSSIIGKLELKLVKHVDSIITVSSPIQTHLKQISGKDVSIIWNYPLKKIIPKISKPNAKKKLGFKEEDFILTYVGSLRNDVALIELIDAINYLSKNNKKELKKYKVKILIVGDGELYSKLLEKVKENNIENYVSVIGNVNRAKSLLYLKASDLSYVLFSIKGLNTIIGMPWKLFESFACDTKVLVMDNTYAAKLIRHYKSGYTLVNANSEFLAKKLLSIFKTDKEESIKSNFYWEEQEKKFISIYENLIKY